MIDGAAVVTAARGHVGTKWMHQARMPGVALDCVGLVIVVARQLSCVAPDFDISGYSRMPNGTMQDLCRQYMDEIPTIELGAVLTLATDKEPHHMGIVGDYRHGGWAIIHASNAARPGRVLETRLMLSSSMQLQGVYRLRAA